MGKLRELKAGVDGLTALALMPPAMPVIQEEPQPDLLLEALNSLVSAVGAIQIPEVKIDLNTAVNKLVKALSGVTFPEHPAVDLLPIVKAIEGITLEVAFPEVPEHKEKEPCPYTFEIVRNRDGVMCRVVATPGLIEYVEPQEPEPEYE